MGVKPSQWSEKQNEEESQLMAAARVDLTRFSPLYERYAPRIYAYCLRRLNSREEAEDVTSQIFTQALRGIGAYRGGSVAAWLFRIAHNMVVSQFRSRRAQVSLDTLDSEWAAESSDLIENVMQDEEWQGVRAFVRSLPDEQQELIALKITAGLSAEEIGAVLGKSAGAVRVEYHRIINRLRRHMSSETRYERN